MRDYKQLEMFKEVTHQEWNDYHWQLNHRITTIGQVKEIIPLSEDEEKGLISCLGKFKMAITPYYASLIDPNDPYCPIRKQAVPDVRELESFKGDMEDPLNEDGDSPVPCIVHRYPDRVLFLIFNQCSMYCRHCTRRRMVGHEETVINRTQIDEGIAYIKSNPKVRDVLLSGGEPLLLNDGDLEYIIKGLRNIPHVEIIRIGTRVPVVLPQRITDDLIKMLQKYQPIWVNTQFNHPKEITSYSKEACEKIVDGGIPLGNQSVLLRDVNDCVYIMRELLTELVKIRVRPYYLYQCDVAKGINHFRTSVAKGIEIIEGLRGHISGFCVPTYIVDTPNGGGKIPIQPNYVLSENDNKLILRNYEGKLFTYTLPQERGTSCHCKKCYSKEVLGVEKMLLE